jgi:Zn-dependent protease with chaperone function
LKAVLLICDFAVAALFVWAINWLALIPFRRSKGKHWTERARVLYPARVGVISEMWAVPVIVALGQHLIFGGSAPHWLLSGVASWAGTLGAVYFLSREVFPETTARTWLHEVLASWSLAFLWVGLFATAAALMPIKPDWRTVVLLALILGAYVAWAFGGLMWCLKKLRMLQPGPDRLQRIVRGVSGRMNIALREVWLLNTSSAAAYALPQTGDVMFSKKLADSAPDDEIASIAAHELAHLGERRLVRLARLTTGMGTLPFLFIRPLFHYLGLPSIVLAGFVYWLVSLWSRNLSHRLEVRADAAGKENEGDEGVYARALARLYEINLLPAVIRKKQSHPDLYDRLVSAGVQPDYPRPEPADPVPVHAVLLWTLLFVLILVTLRLEM